MPPKRQNSRQNRRNDLDEFVFDENISAGHPVPALRAPQNTKQ